MRLIDADDFDVITYKETESYSDCFDSGVLYMLDRIDVAPTVDAVEIVHGHWVQRWTGNEYIVFCSKCRTEATEIVDYELEYNYCPNCGAKMDEVSE